MPRMDDATRLTGRDKRILLAIVVAGVVSLIIGLRLFPSVFPEATIRFEIDRAESEGIAERWLREQDFHPDGYRHASAFLYADTAKVFLERELGLAAMNDAVEQTARIWAWSHRWFRPLQVEEFRVDIAPTGELVRFVHLLPDTAAGPDLAEQAARRIAEHHLDEIRPNGLQQLRYLGATARKCDHRTDYRFTWEEEGIDWQGGRYRHNVTIRGSRLGGYEQFVKVPEDWNRDYSRLRSKNGAAGSIASVFFILTLFAMLIVLVIQAKRRLIRWRFAEVLGAIAAGLVLVSGFNGLPQALYGYDTRQSFGGFLSETIVLNILSSLGAGLLILIFVAAGENQYRIGYRRKLSLPSVFTWHGLRTKEFLFSALGGLALTCIFLLYQTLFYRAANALGAWSPAEVPYSELLNSAFPMAFLLYIGFFPAVSEEFMSRAFSVPFLTRIARSRIFAILLASAIWGFGHSAYPNQPFYIRGLELLIAGSLICFIMLRFNVVVLLVWHYTVDALYSGYFLFQSGHPYYVASAAIAAGILVLPLGIAVVAYVRTRRFSDPEPLRNAVEPIPEIPRETVPVPLIVHRVQPIGRRRVLFLLVSGVAALVASLMISASMKQKLPEVPVRVSRTEALEKSNAFLEQTGIDTDRFDTVAQFGDESGPSLKRYLQANLGVSGLAAFWPDRLANQTWVLRYYIPEVVEELGVRVDATTGRIISLSHRVAEKDSLPGVTVTEAESLAVRVLASVGLDVGGMERKEAADVPRPRRLDRHFAWEAKDGDPRNVAQARYRIEADVTGNRAAGFEEMVRLPEDYTRARGRRTILWWIALGTVLFGCGIATGITIRDAVRDQSHGPMRWAQEIGVGFAALVVALIATINALPRVIARYETSVPWSSYVIVIAVGFVTAVVVYFFLGWAGSVMVQRLHPKVGAIRDRESRRRMIPGTLLAIGLTPIWMHLLSSFRMLMTEAMPSVSPPLSLGIEPHVETTIPAISVVVAALPHTFLTCLVVAVALHWFTSSAWPGKWPRLLLACLIGVSFAILPARSVGEFLVTLVRLGLFTTVGIGLVRFVFRDNPLAYIGGIYGLVASEGVVSLMTQGDEWVRGHGIAAGVLLALPVVWLIVEIVRDSRLAMAKEST